MAQMQKQNNENQRNSPKNYLCKKQKLFLLFIELDRNSYDIKQRCVTQHKIHYTAISR